MQGVCGTECGRRQSGGGSLATLATWLIHGDPIFKSQLVIKLVNIGFHKLSG